MSGRTISCARAADDILASRLDPLHSKNSQIEREDLRTIAAMHRRSAIGLLALAFPLGLLVGNPRADATPTQPGELQQGLEPISSCESCHDFMSNEVDLANGGSVEPWAWQGSMMANSARDPVFWAGVAIASQDQAEPGETEACVRCHSPRAFLDGQADVIALDQLSNNQRAGIECDLCHRMIDDFTTPPGDAQFVLTDAPIGEPIMRRGPWTYAEFGPEPQHAWAQDLEFLASSKMCGTCHDVSTPRERVDDRGVGLGVVFNEQRTYAEWLGSDFAEPGPDQRSCQDCHMPAIPTPTIGCNMFAGAPHASGGRRHVLVGANVGGMKLVESLYGDAGTGEVADWRYDESIGWAEEFVRTSASLEVAFPDAIDLGEGLTGLPVTVTNETGHKLPTGYSEGRVMWIEVTARYQGTLVWSSGLLDSVAGTIEDDPQVRRYEAIAERWSDGASLHLLLNDHWVVDSRIPPKGLIANLETDPVGDRYALQGDDTWPNFDAITYAFEPATIDDVTPGQPDTLELEVRLLYWLNTPSYLEFLVDENQTNDAGTHVADAFDAIGGSVPVVLAEASASVPLTGLLGGGETESGESETHGESGESGESETESGDDEIGETGPSLDEGGESGCSCTTGDSPGRPLLGLFGLAILLLPLRRRPARSEN
jgi:MYXO-CTERM domain-containing protein